jgi:hypothetical protein
MIVGVSGFHCPLLIDFVDIDFSGTTSCCLSASTGAGHASSILL